MWSMGVVGPGRHRAAMMFGGRRAPLVWRRPGSALGEGGPVFGLAHLRGRAAMGLVRPLSPAGTSVRAGAWGGGRAGLDAGAINSGPTVGLPARCPWRLRPSRGPRRHLR